MAIVVARQVLNLAAVPRADGAERLEELYNLILSYRTISLNENLSVNHNLRVRTLFSTFQK